jgi:diacylglycerol kinase (ATP)
METQYAIIGLYLFCERIIGYNIEAWRVEALCKKNLKHLADATRNSFRGLRVAWTEETAFRQECFVLAGIVISVFVVPNLTVGDKILLIGTWLFVMSMELLNTAVECAFDSVTKEFHPLIKKGKDAASAAIFVAICLNALLWVKYAVTFW